MKPSTEQDYYQRILRALLYIQRHLDEELTLDQVAVEAAFSSFHFHRIFHALVGEAFREHIRRLRLERAAVHLKRLSEPITQIALQAGFESHEAFTRAFRAMFGVSPSGYRAAHRPPPEPASGIHLGDASGYHPPDYGDPPAVEVKEVPPMRIVFLRHRGPYEQVSATWGRLMSWAGARGLLGQPFRSIGIVHDDPEVTPADKVRYDAGVTINRAVQPEGEFGALELAGGCYAIVTHRGPYEALGKTYRRFYGGWLPKSGYELRDAMPFEEYLNSPQETGPEELVTLIHVPLR
jgi:AraC family transcriptional regulator